MLVYRLEPEPWIHGDIHSAALSAARRGLSDPVLAAEEYGDQRPAYEHERQLFGRLVEEFRETA